MVKAETRKFVEENRELLEEVASRKGSPVAPLAAAFLTAVGREEDEGSQRAKSPSKDTDGDTGSGVKLEDIRRGEDDAGRQEKREEEE